MSEQSYAIGKGEVHVAGVYLGNTPRLSVIAAAGKTRVAIVTDNMTEENVMLAFSAAIKPMVKVEFRPQNPVGPNRGFNVTGRLVLGEIRLKREESWQECHYEVEVEDLAFVISED